MTKHIDSIKIKLIEEIASISSEAELEQVVRYLKLTRMRHLHGDLFGGIRKSLTIEDLKNEQDFKGIDRKEFDRLVEEIDIQEPIDELLAMLD